MAKQYLEVTRGRKTRNTPETHTEKSLHILSSSSDRSHKARIRWCRSDMVILTLEYKHSKAGVQHMVLMQ